MAAPRSPRSPRPRSPRIPSSYSFSQEYEESSAPTQKTPWRRVLGLSLLAVVIVLWVASGFLTSSIFATGQYSKPYLITYINTAFFAFPLLPVYLRHFYKIQSWRIPSWGSNTTNADKTAYHALSDTDSSSLAPSEDQDDRPRPQDRTRFLSPSDAAARSLTRSRSPSSSLRIDTSVSPHHRRVLSTNPAEQPDDQLSTRATFHLAMRFAPLWFLANWFNSASYSYTSVASSTILVSTSSVFTLLFGAIMKIEAFTLKKLLGVLASLAGIVLISLIDTRATNEDDTDRGAFPFKTPAEIALGDAMALASAVLYGLYATILTATVGADESAGRIHMPLFFGFLGAISIMILWPGLPILSLVGMETLQAPPSAHAAWIVLANAGVSLVSDMCWAYAVLLTSPLVVTVGLALTIPLSLVGQVLLNGQYAGWGYWVGAAIIVGGFVVVNLESEEGAKGVEEAPVKERQSAVPERREWRERSLERERT